METKRRILVVDHEPDFVKLVVETFKASFKVISASSREEGLKKTKRHTPDLIILGYLEPQGTCIEFCKELTEVLTAKNIPILVADVPIDRHYRRKGWKIGNGLQLDADGYISRPIEPIRLREAVADICKHSPSRCSNN